MAHIISPALYSSFVTGVSLTLDDREGDIYESCLAGYLAAGTNVGGRQVPKKDFTRRLISAISMITKTNVVLLQPSHCSAGEGVLDWERRCR